MRPPPLAAPRAPMAAPAIARQLMARARAGLLPRRPYQHRTFASSLSSGTDGVDGVDAFPLPDLHAHLPADPAPFAAVTQWVLFSDLHVCERTLDASLASLAAVRREVEGRGGSAGAIFLGDWWHARGALPVRPLNRGKIDDKREVMKGDERGTNRDDL